MFCQILKRSATQRVSTAATTACHLREADGCVVGVSWAGRAAGTTLAPPTHGPSPSPGASPRLPSSTVPSLRPCEPAARHVARAVGAARSPPPPGSQTPPSEAGPRVQPSLLLAPSRPCCPHSPRALPGEERFISHLRGCLLGLCPDDPAVHTHSAWTLWSPQHLRASWRQLWQINLHSTTQGTDSMWASGVPLFSALCARQCEAGRHQEGRV